MSEEYGDEGLDAVSWLCMVSLRDPRGLGWQRQEDCVPRLREKQSTFEEPVRRNPWLPVPVQRPPASLVFNVDSDSRSPAQNPIPKRINLSLSSAAAMSDSSAMSDPKRTPSPLSTAAHAANQENELDLNMQSAIVFMKVASS